MDKESSLFNDSYLTEVLLGNYLETIFSEFEFERDRVVPNSKIRNRADYRNDKLMLIVEFDGYRHYSETKTILADEKKDIIYSGLGYKIIRIPYFVQISKDVVFDLFGVHTNIPQVYSHGFIDKKALLPSDFCELGIKRFLFDLNRFSYIKSEIISSLKNKIEELGDIRLVLPYSLFYLIKF